MKEVFTAIFNKYTGSVLESLTPGGLVSYIDPESNEENYIVMSMLPSKIEWATNRNQFDVKIELDAACKLDKGQDEINSIKDSIISLYDGLQPGGLEITGYDLVHMKAVELMQYIDDEDVENLLWRYYVRFEVKINKQ